MENSKEKKRLVGVTIGIDLGTTNSCVAVTTGKGWKVIENPDGQRITPSVVSFDKREDRFVVGQLAKQMAVLSPEETFASVKRDMGKNIKSNEALRRKYRVVKKSGEAVQLSPEEVSSHILSYLKDFAEKSLGVPVRNAVITVPAYFDDAQRDSTIKAGKIAGLNVARIINEPTAAVLAYGLDKSGTSEHPEKVLVYDLGGGTFDVTIIEIQNGVFRTLSKAGDNRLGGDDIDELIVDYLVEEFKKKNGVNLHECPDSISIMQRLSDSAERAKKTLSSSNYTVINEPFITISRANTPLNLHSELTIKKFESMIHEKVIERTWNLVQEALVEAKLSPASIDKILLVGGSTRIPVIQKMIEERMGKKPDFSINPDEVVAVGAAIQASILGGEIKDILLLDTTPLTLGIEVAGGIMVPIIPKNTTIPTSKTREDFTTKFDNQDSVSIVVHQGESQLVKDNIKLGNFELSGIQKAAAGIPRISVQFNVDANSTLSITAKDLSTKKESSYRIVNTSRLSDKDVEEMIEKAEKNREKNKKIVEQIELINRAQELVNQLDRTITEAKKQGKSDKDLEELTKLREKFDLLIKNKDYEEIKKQMQLVSDMIAKMSSFAPSSGPEKDSGPNNGQPSSDSKPGTEGGFQNSEKNKNSEKKNKKNSEKDDKKSDKK